jgi:hypothetical protein
LLLLLLAAAAAAAAAAEAAAAALAAPDVTKSRCESSFRTLKLWISFAIEF